MTSEGNSVDNEGVLDPWVSAWITENPMRATPFEDLVPEILELARGPYGMPSTREIAHISDETVGNVPIRIYQNDGEPTGLIVYFHGGGFVIGSIGLMDNVARELAHLSGAVVISVEYRLAPENPFPAGLEDCYASLVWLARNAEQLGIDADNIVIHGASAGGGLCAALAILARDRGGPTIAFQYLGIPELDDRLATASMQAFTDTPLWNLPSAEHSWDCYLGEGVRGTAEVSPYAAPARATDLTGLPPAYISAMHFDPLRDEDIAYAQALLAAGVTVELHLFPGTFHGSTLATKAEVSKREMAESLAVLGRALKPAD
jgi:acetyl esterase